MGGDAVTVERCVEASVGFVSEHDGVGTDRCEVIAGDHDLTVGLNGNDITQIISGAHRGCDKAVTISGIPVESWVKRAVRIEPDH